jgi:anaphase-promoting complex subunit 11
MRSFYLNTVWGQCTHVFHMHCLLKWIDTESSKGQCPMDRRPWGASRAGGQPPFPLPEAGASY